MSRICLSFAFPLIWKELTGTYNKEDPAMAVRTKGKKAIKSKTKKTAVKKTVRKKSLKKKAGTSKKAVVKKTARKKGAKKKIVAKKRSPAKPARKPASKTETMASMELKSALVEPGPTPGGIPPVEEPAENEEAVGTVTHYYSHLGVAIIQINKDRLKTGDTIHIKGHTTDFNQKIESIEYEHRRVEDACAGQSIGVKVIDHTREHDIVYRVK